MAVNALRGNSPPAALGVFRNHGARLTLAASRLAGLLLLTLVGSFAAAVAIAGHGQHATGPAAADPCRDNTQPASLHCAQAVSARFDRDGRLGLVWAQHGHVYVNYSDDKGKSFSTPRAVNRVPEAVIARGENRPKLAWGPRGELYISWTQALTKRFTGHIRFARSLDRGKTFSEPLIVNDERSEISHRFETLAVDGEGRVFLAWLDKRDQAAAQARGVPYAGAAVYYSWSDDQGSSFKANRKLADNSCECCRVMADITPSGQPVLMWRHVFPTHIRDHAVLTFSDIERPGDMLRVSFDNWQVDACPHHGPAISIDDKGGYHFVWFNNAQQRKGIFYARSADRGQNLSEPLSIGNYAQSAAHADILAQGQRLYLVWQEFDGSQTRIQLMRSEDLGRNWQAPELIAKASGEVDYPFLLADREAVFVSWQTAATGFKLIRLE